ncbi:TonB-dependent receptor domain-containing protein, partial [Stenotrophomonas maltophilia]|uniref:TonB-dependent receptor domain-containing protein n=1 Tax=Stenotrophomonas maltophilia TaxID=40324 RepID=UPI00313A8A2E
SDGENVESEHTVTSPDAGLVFDISDTYSAYASYTEIFQPPTARDRNDRSLDPVDGTSYEEGVKAARDDNRQKASL